MPNKRSPRSGGSYALRVTGAVLLAFALGTACAESLRFRLVDRADVEGRLRDYGGTNRERGARLKRTFGDAGCGEHLTEQAARFSRDPPNVVCVLPGASDRVIIVGAHFDRVPESDGVVDNWSGASLLPSLYQAVKAQPRRHTYVFIGFTDEEKGLVGSYSYARKMTRAQVQATDAMVNLDTLGLAPTEVWVNRSDLKLTQAFFGIAKLINLPVHDVNFEDVGSTDSESFADRGIRTITIHSLTQSSENARILHTSRDKLSVMNLDQYYDTYHLVTVYLVFLDHFFDESESRDAAPPPSRTDE